VGVAVEYVMVPVPEELAPKVLSYVSWKGQPRLVSQLERQYASPSTSVEAPDTGDPIARTLAGLDDAGRAIARVIAWAALDEEQLTVPEAARRAGITTREAVGMILELGNRIVGEGGPPLATFIKDGEGATAGEFTWDTRVVVMQEAVARPLADLAQTYASG
jgi:hypothetical protein